MYHYLTAELILQTVLSRDIIVRRDKDTVLHYDTIDHETLEEGTVTIRERDTMKQVRVPIADGDTRGIGIA